MNILLKKYNVAAPRYTSYPTVPHWESDKFTTEKWLMALQKTYNDHKEEGISLYIHLPFCENLCTYCGCNTRITKNHNVELPYLKAVLKEWEMYTSALGEKPKIKEIHLGGGTPTFFSPANLETLILGIVGQSVGDMDCSFEGHPDNTTIDHLQTLHHLGFKRLSLGIQDFDPKVQLMINRYQTPGQVLAITSQARAIGYESINFDLIYGLPFQTLAGLSETLTEVIAMKPERIAFYSYAHVPWMKPGQRHYHEKDIPQGDEKFALYQMGRERLIEAGYQEIGMDHFALKKDKLFKASQHAQLHRNFMGYTDRYTKILIGLGVSSISDCHTAFVQNNKTVEGYLKDIENGSIAIEKGHLATPEDLLIKAHILNLMCKGLTCFENQIPIPTQQRLSELQADHLIEMDGKQICVTSVGRSFLRNICMALDERLWKFKSETSLFSKAV